MTRRNDHVRHHRSRSREPQNRALESPSARSPSALVRWELAALFVLLVLARFYHLSHDLDDPHSWRQADTAVCARELYRHGMDLLHPRVNWCGPTPVVAFEFPFYEGLVACAYRLFGERILLARLVTIVCWAVSAAYLHRLISWLGNPRWANAATLLYAASPLGIYYSRAVHIDFAAIALAHGMLYHFLRAIHAAPDSRDRYAHRALGAVLGAIAFAIKGPYPALLYVVLLVELFRSTRWRNRALWPWLAVPWVAFVAWQRHVASVNQASGEYAFVPGLFKLVRMEWWYFGSLGQRFDPGNWLLIGGRVLWEVLTPIGLLLAVGGLALRWRERVRVGIWESWLLACAVYVLVFFNLNLEHNYYQLPLVAPIAVFAGLGLSRLMQGGGGRAVAGIAIAAVLAAVAAYFAAASYYVPDTLKQAAGLAIQSATRANDLVVVGYRGAEAHDPRLLYWADRHGFVIAEEALSSERLAASRAAGVVWVAIMRTADEQVRLPERNWGYPAQSFDLRMGSSVIGRLVLLRLRS